MVEFYRPVFIALQTALDTGIQNISSRLELSIYTSISDSGFKFIKFHQEHGARIRDCCTNIQVKMLDDVCSACIDGCLSVLHVEIYELSNSYQNLSEFK